MISRDGGSETHRGLFTFRSALRLEMAHVLPPSTTRGESESRNLVPVKRQRVANENIGKEDTSMSLNQPLVWRNPMETEVASQLAHVKSELCWCDPIVEIDEYGQKVVMHKEVTWH